MFEMAMMLAQEAVVQDSMNFGKMGLGIGVGLVILGAGWGIGRIGGTAVESISRQPEAAGPISTQMLISAALIEGVTVIALIVMFMLNG
ncbi:ATP synthase F0 subunit C [Novipirellula artificiosorum]|uniref:ATP synthase subunit c n=1 Tax=Novipirellula artificiosorum TaxID=2528016 RepID=A0A5C6D2A0_9BACT|nr:ATP synthase F0 subunit C [Novipirellula artificiosorum]TWU30960.1 ATP synthase subunit c [Novipirellula artificiosorum]